MIDPSQSEVKLRMLALIERWEQDRDRRAVFLRCYLMMTDNMLLAIQAGEFHAAAWVNGLLEHFAGYYFSGLEAYEHNRADAPPVWRLAHDTAQNPSAIVLQHLLLGINAHINYDLVLALQDALVPVWSSLSEDLRQQRYKDYCRVNDVLGRTIDAVQNDIVDQAMPVMEVVDLMMGPVDEWMVSHLIAHWRDRVWREAASLMETESPQERAAQLQQIEAETLRRAHAILGQRGLAALSDLL